MCACENTDIVIYVSRYRWLVGGNGVSLVSLLSISLSLPLSIFLNLDEEEEEEEETLTGKLIAKFRRILWIFFLFNYFVVKQWIEVELVDDEVEFVYYYRF